MVAAAWASSFNLTDTSDVCGSLTYTLITGNTLNITTTTAKGPIPINSNITAINTKKYIPRSEQEIYLNVTEKKLEGLCVTT